MRNLVYLLGIPKNSLSREDLKSNYFFGQFGPIKKLILNSNNKTNSATNSAYITFESEISAAMAILTVDSVAFQNKYFKASFGMTKYCSFFLKNQGCPKSECLFLHRKANKEDIATVKNKVSQKVHITMTTEDVVEYCLNLGAEEIRQFEKDYKEIYSLTDEEDEDMKYWKEVIPSVENTLEFIKKKFEEKYKMSIYDQKLPKKKKKEKSINLSAKKNPVLKW